MAIVFIIPKPKCNKPNTHTAKHTVTRRGKTEAAAYQAAMPLAMRHVYDEFTAFRKAVKCPTGCKERSDDTSTKASATYSYSRWHAFLSYLPFGGAGGWSCTATFTGTISITCKGAGE